MTIFEKIIARDIPADIVYEDPETIAFRDVHPQAPVHVLIVPKRLVERIGDIRDGDAELLGKLFLAAQKIAAQEGVMHTGYRLVVNHGKDAGESVPHLHIHLLGGRAASAGPQVETLL